MKSKLKSEKIKQNNLEGSLQAVSKRRDFITSSTALSQETTKSETLGQTRINPLTGKPRYYKDNPITKKAENGKQMYVNSNYVSKTHPLYKAGRYKGFEDAAFSSLENFKDSPQGQVYIITNPAWEGWVKVGMAVDAVDRTGNYQTSSPYRDYELGYVVDTQDRRATEAETHARLGDLFEQRNEWFKCTVEMAERIIDGVLEEEYEEAC